MLVSYFAVLYLLRLFVASQSLQVNDYFFLLLFSLFLVLGILSYFSLYFCHPLNFCRPLKYVVGEKLFVFLLVYFGFCIPVWDHSWCVVSCNSGVYSGGGPYFISCCGCGRCLCSVLMSFFKFFYCCLKYISQLF